MQKKTFLKLSIKNIISILKEEDILSKTSFNEENISTKSDFYCFVFFNSHDVEEFLTQPGNDHFIYIARTGKTFDGHSLANKILNSNQFFIGDEKKYIPHPNFIPVKNTENALNHILKTGFGINEDEFLSIGITGTNGKTSTTQITSQILEHLFNMKILRIGTLGIQIGDETQSGSHVTTPDFSTFLCSLQKAKSMNINKLVMEITSHGLKEKRTLDWKFDVGVFTNLTQDHLDYHKTIEDYRSSKELLFKEKLKNNGTAVININNPESFYFVEAAAHQKRSLFLVSTTPFVKEQISTYNEKFQNVSLLNLENSKADLLGLSGTLVFQKHLSSQAQRVSFSCPLIGHFQLENLVCSVAASMALGFSIQEVASILTKIKNIQGRLELITEESNKSAPKVIVDYAHTPDALEKAILTCKSTLTKDGKLTTVFGCGGDRDPSKRAPMGKIASSLSHRVIVTSDNPRTENPEQIIDDIFQGIDKKHDVFREVNRAKAIQYAILTSTENDLVLVAGKGHENYQLIGHTKHPFSDAATVKDILLQNNSTGKS